MVKIDGENRNFTTKMAGIKQSNNLKKIEINDG
jgi:hypothetical protein